MRLLALTLLLSSAAAAQPADSVQVGCGDSVRLMLDLARTSLPAWKAGSVGVVLVNDSPTYARFFREAADGTGAFVLERWLYDEQSWILHESSDGSSPLEPGEHDRAFVLPGRVHIARVTWGPTTSGRYRIAARCRPDRSTTPGRHGVVPGWLFSEPFLLYAYPQGGRGILDTVPPPPLGDG